MTRVDFYILDDSDPMAALHYACRLIEKAYRGGHRVCVRTENQSQAQQLDALLWTYRGEAFIPHSSEDAAEAIYIDAGGNPGEHSDVLVNLGTALPDHFSRFKRLAEIVCQQPQWLQASRERYALYKHRGYPLHTHSISES